jgi:type IV pilus assembly protein PilE
MKRFNGFSLIELLVVVAIMGILAAIALPAYRDYVIRGKLAEAYSLLGAQRVKMEQYYQDVRDYTNACSGTTVAFPLPVGQYFTLTCGNLGANSYTITATGNAGQGADNSYSPSTKTTPAQRPVYRPVGPQRELAGFALRTATAEIVTASSLLAGQR